MNLRLPLILVIALLCVLACSKPEDEPTPVTPKPDPTKPDPVTPDPVKTGWIIDTVEWKSTGTFAKQIKKAPDGGYYISTDLQVGRITADGSANASFQVGEASEGEIVKLIPHNDKLLVIGNFLKFNGKETHGIVRLNSNGSVDESFKPAIKITASQNRVGVIDLVVTPEGDYVFCGGNFEVATGIQREEATSGGYSTHIVDCFAKNIAKVKGSDGSFVKEFGAETDPSYFKERYLYAFWSSSAKMIHMFADGSMFYVGQYSEYNTAIPGTFKSFYNNAIIKITKDGHIDKTYIAKNVTNDAYHNGFGSANSMFEMEDGRLLIAGNFQIIENTMLLKNHAFFDPATASVSGAAPELIIDNVTCGIKFDNKIILGTAQRKSEVTGEYMGYGNVIVRDFTTGEKIDIDEVLHPDYKGMMTTPHVADKSQTGKSFVKYGSEVFDFVQESPTSFLVAGFFVTSVTYYPNTNKTEVKRARGILRFVKK